MTEEVVFCELQLFDLSLTGAEVLERGLLAAGEIVVPGTVILKDCVSSLNMMPTESYEGFLCFTVRVTAGASGLLCDAFSKHGISIKSADVIDPSRELEEMFTIQRELSEYWRERADTYE